MSTESEQRRPSALELLKGLGFLLFGIAAFFALLAGGVFLFEALMWAFGVSPRDVTLANDPVYFAVLVWFGLAPALFVLAWRRFGWMRRWFGVLAFAAAFLLPAAIAVVVERG